MVYVTKNGALRERHLILRVIEALGRTSLEKRAIGLVVLGIVLRYWPNKNPLANNAIPAAMVRPENHWKRIQDDSHFVRTMTESLVAINKRKTSYAELSKKHIESGDMKMLLGKVDFGGSDGHVFEKARDTRGLSLVESYQGTRCSSSQSALTSYFCGATIAGNRDVALGAKRKPVFRGLYTFLDHINCRHDEGERNGGRHRRFVYRLGIACEDNHAGYSHAFNIVAQPDGTFFWLQSFISRYSLNTWMTNERGRHGHLNVAELRQKLIQLDRLMKISEWTGQANTDYLELFGVDKEKEALGKSPVRSTWLPTHRLEYFYWDEACEYPIPNEESEGTPASSIDNCSIQSLFGTSKDFGNWMNAI